jgi:LPXTG-site transpeptidase (sortase) family protein
VRGRVFFISFILLGLLSGLSQPAVVRPLLYGRPTATPTATPLPPTVTPSPTIDYFAHVPTATSVAGSGTIIQPLPSPALGEFPPTALAPAPTETATAVGVTGVWPTPVIVDTLSVIAPPPDRLEIPRLALDAPVEPVGPIGSDATTGLFEWAVPEQRAAGWLNQSAPFGLAGNTVLAGHHNIAGEVFRDLWTLQAGDEIILWAGPVTRAYRVAEVLILPERDQPPARRLANARYIEPTSDERLTLITCWPYDDNSHRVVVIARPAAGDGP